MTNETAAALKYLYSTLDFSNQDSFTFTLDIDGEATCEDLEEFCVVDEENPIADLIASVNREMCLDCLQIDYLLKDPFFRSLISAYVETLFIEFGDEVPISVEMARTLVRNNLTEKSVIYVYEGANVLVTPENIDQYNHLTEESAFILSNE